MPKIKLTSNSFKNYTGFLGTVMFEEGVSVEPTNTSEMNRLAALTSVEIVKEDGESGGQAGLGAGMAKARTATIPVLKNSERGEAEPYQAEKNATDVEVGAPKAKVEDTDATESELDELTAELSDVPDAEEPATVYSKDQLEEIADKEGIAGLRKISDPLGVKDNSIAGLIKEITNAQGNA